jgi:hypothetical protein
MQPSAGLTSQRQDQYAWQIASLALCTTMSRFSDLHKTATTRPTVDMYIGGEKSAQDYFDAIKKQQPQVQMLHKKVCQCMIHFLENTNLAVNNPLREKTRSAYIEIIELVEQQAISETSAIIQITAIESIFAALKSAKK